RINFGVKLSEEQSQAKNWVAQSFPPHPSFTVDLAKWRNKYAKLLAAADASISCIPLLRKKALSENSPDKVAADTPLPESQSNFTSQPQSLAKTSSNILEVNTQLLESQSKNCQSA
ncbi:hypothetical protein OnM2_105004, partial [Erysiphe neolycopersici]